MLKEEYSLFKTRQTSLEKSMTSPLLTATSLVFFRMQVQISVVFDLIFHTIGLQLSFQTTQGLDCSIWSSE